MVAHLGGYERRLATKYLLDDEKSPLPTLGGNTVWYMWFRLLAPYAYLLFVYIFTLYVGYGIGVLACYRWLTVTVIAVVVDAVWQSGYIWTTYVFLPYLVRRRLLILQHLLQFRSRYLMSRYEGMMKSANGMMHHFNPACRAARFYFFSFYLFCFVSILLAPVFFAFYLHFYQYLFI